MSQKNEPSTDDINFTSYEIDLIEQVKTLWKDRVKILIITAIFTFIGIFHYVSGPEEFMSTATLIQETDQAGGTAGNFLMRSLFGGNVGSMDGITAAARGYAPPPPGLYPRIIASSTFQYELIYQPVEFANLDTTMTMMHFFTEVYQPPLRDRVYRIVSDYTIKLPFTLYRGLRNLIRNITSREESGSSIDVLTEVTEEIELDDRLLNLSRQELRVIRILIERIRLAQPEGLIEVSTILPDPKAAALVNAHLIDRIQEFMTEYRVEKAKHNLEFTIDQYEIARERYLEANRDFTIFLDQNRNISTATAQSELDHLADRRNIKFNIYNSIAREVEQARLTVQQQTPVFNVLEKSDIPTSPYLGASNLILVFSVVIGFFVGIIWVLVSAKLKSLRLYDE